MLSSQLCDETGKERRGGREVEEGRENKTNSENISKKKESRSRDRKMKTMSLVLLPFQKIWGMSNKNPNPWPNLRPSCWCWQPKIWSHGSPIFTECRSQYGPLVGTRKIHRGAQMHRLQGLSGNIHEACCLMGPQQDQVGAHRSWLK